MADARERGAVRHELFIESELLVDRFQKRDLVVVIVDRELAREAGPDLGERCAIAPQQPHAERVKGRDEWRFGSSGVAEQAVDAVAHLLSGFVGKRDRQNGGPGYVMRFNQVRDAMRDDARLAAAGAGEQQERTFDMGNGFALLRI